MPCIILPLDPVLGPVLDIGISAPTATMASGSPRPAIHWIKAIADTGCSNTAVHTSVTPICGLRTIGKALTNTAAGPVPINVFLADIFIRVTSPTGPGVRMAVSESNTWRIDP